MAKCGDCLYFGFCEKYIEPEETFPEIGGCHTFKSKDAFVEVVRCKDCLWFDQKDKLADVFRQERHCYCTDMNTYMPESGFCSSGERKDNERKAD